MDEDSHVGHYGRYGYPAARIGFYTRYDRASRELSITTQSAEAPKFASAHGTIVRRRSGVGTQLVSSVHQIWACCTLAPTSSPRERFRHKKVLNGGDPQDLCSPDMRKPMMYGRVPAPLLAWSQVSQMTATCITEERPLYRH